MTMTCDSGSARPGSQCSDSGSSLHSSTLRGTKWAPGTTPSLARWLSPRMSISTAPLSIAARAPSGSGRSSRARAAARRSSTVTAGKLTYVRPTASDLVDHRLLHVEARSRAATHAEHEAHTFFQASTLDSLFAGRLEGDLSFAELAEHGDLGIGTLNAVDGEMIAVDGRFMRADADGAIGDVPPEARTPFAVV